MGLPYLRLTESDNRLELSKAVGRVFESPQERTKGAYLEYLKTSPFSILIPQTKLLLLPCRS